MTRTKWMRLLVRDLSEVVRWASRQNALHIDNFRYRVVHGQESVSFRLVPSYAIQVGTTDIIVICHVRASRLRQVAARTIRTGRRLGRQIEAALRPLAARQVQNRLAGRELPQEGAAPKGELRTLPWVRTGSLSPS